MNNKLTITCTLAALFAFSPVFADACGDKGKHDCGQAKTEKAGAKCPAAKQSGDTSGKVQAGKAEARKVEKEELGKEATCPVMKDSFKVDEKTLSASYKGKVYYFCCPGCSKPFIENPEKYLQKKQEASTKAYACPMNCAKSDKPGKCPKCGMNMTEKK